jgi:hypothetical protein
MTPSYVEASRIFVMIARSTAASSDGNRKARSSMKSSAGESEGNAGAAYSAGNGLRLHKAYMSLLPSQQTDQLHAIQTSHLTWAVRSRAIMDVSGLEGRSIGRCLSRSADMPMT